MNCKCCGSETEPILDYHQPNNEIGPDTLVTEIIGYELHCLECWYDYLKECAALESDSYNDLDHSGGGDDLPW